MLVAALGAGVRATPALALRQERSVSLVAVTVFGLLVLLVAVGEPGAG